MARGNGKSEVDPAELDPEHELPAAEDTRDGAAVPSRARREEFDKLKAERDSLIDRLARFRPSSRMPASALPASSRSSASMPSPTR